MSASDKGTGKTQDIKITGASTLSEAEVEKMVKDAETFAGEDAKKREAGGRRATSLYFAGTLHPCHSFHLTFGRIFRDETALWLS